MKTRPALELADIFRQFADPYLQENRAAVSTEQMRVLSAIRRCRTAILGGHVKECDECGHQEISYNSCRNRHCPKCQGGESAEWFKARQEELLPVHYFHVVFTLPEELRQIALQNKKTVYGILFRAAAETLRQVARTRLGADIGFFGILHTWGQNLLHHPHIHFVVPGGGLSPDRSRWVSVPKRFFLPLEVLKIVFRGKFLEFLGQAFADGELSFGGSLARLADPAAFKRLLQKASKYRWVVHVKPPFAGPEAVLKYLAGYTHRIAISNHRLLSLVGRKVTFRWKDYRDGSREKIMTLDVFEFIRRFLLHVLPKRFPKIRYYGLLSTRKRKETLLRCRELLAKENSSDHAAIAPVDAQEEPSTDKEDRHLEPCPVCQKGRLISIERWPPSRATPRPRLFLPAIIDTS